MPDRIQFRQFERIGVDLENGVLHGVIVCALGEAQGHGYEITSEFLDALVEQGNANGAVRFRIDPPDKKIHGGAVSIKGKATHFRRDGEYTRCDITLLNLDDEDTKHVLQLAEKAPEMFGVSISADVRPGKKAANGLKPVELVKLEALDLVDTPAAVPALFSDVGSVHRTATEEKIGVAVNASYKKAPPSNPSVVDKKFKGTDMKNEHFLAACKKHGIDPKAADATELLMVKFAAVETDAETTKAQLAESEKKVEELEAAEGAHCEGCGAPVGEDGKFHEELEAAEGDEKKDGEEEADLEETDEEEEASKESKMSARRDAKGNLTLSEKTLETMLARNTARTVHMCITKGLAATGQKKVKFTKPTDGADKEDKSADGPVPVKITQPVRLLAKKINLKDDEVALALAKLPDDNARNFCLDTGTNPIEMLGTIERFPTFAKRN